MRSLAALTTTAAVALMGVASAQNSDQAIAPDAAPVVAPATGSAALQSALVAYAAYHTDVSDMRALQINNAAALETAIDTGARHNREALTRGWVAYGAYTAAQSPAFVQGVRDAAAYYGRDAVIWAVSVDPSYARGLRGGGEATRMVLDSAAADSQRIIAVADRYQELAYGLQRQRWANQPAPQQPARVQRVRTLGSAGGYATTVSSEVSARLAPAVLSLQPTSDSTAFGGRRFWDGLRGDAQTVEVSSASARWSVYEPRGEVLNRMTALAALQALDAAEDRATTVSALLDDPRSEDCLEMAQLQLYQCMSAARFRYENAFCLGQHALRDVGLCVGSLALPDTAAMTPISGAAVAPLAGARH